MTTESKCKMVPCRHLKTQLITDAAKHICMVYPELISFAVCSVIKKVSQHMPHLVNDVLVAIVPLS